MRLSVPSLAALCALLCAGCTPRKVRMARKLEGRYDVGIPDPATWLRVDPGGADKAWYNGHLEASIYTDSNCGSRFLDGRPEQLLRHLMHGLDHPEELRNEPLEVAGRTGRISVQRGLLDGLEVQVGAVVFNRGACTYDIVFIAPPTHFDDGWPAFEGVLEGYQAHGEEP